jgi:hypothetical protein
VRNPRMSKKRDREGRPNVAFIVWLGR